MIYSLCGWLSSGSAADQEELSARQRLWHLALESLRHGTDPDDPDFWNWDRDDQGLVDASKIAITLLLAPEFLPQDDLALRSRLRTCLEATRGIVPHFNNWLLFSATIESAIGMLGGKADLMRIDYALNQFDQWYVGDSYYKDGPEFHMDYYNSLVIHPFILVCLEYLSARAPSRIKAGRIEQQRERIKRHAEILERNISPEGTFPALGRSLGYRCGVFGTLGFAASRGLLPETPHPAQVRCALTAVLERFMAAQGLQDENGILTAGFIGHQPGGTEFYLQDSASYLMLYPFQILALPPDDPFWMAECRPWTTLALWSGQTVAPDKALGHSLSYVLHPSRQT